MRKSLSKRKYSNRKYSKKRYKTNKKRKNIKKRIKYTKRKNKKKTLRLIGGSRGAQRKLNDEELLQKVTQELGPIAMYEMMYNEMCDYKNKGQNYLDYMREKQPIDSNSGRDNSDFKKLWDSITNDCEKIHIFTNESNEFNTEGVTLKNIIKELKEIDRLGYGLSSAMETSVYDAAVLKSPKERFGFAKVYDDRLHEERLENYIDRQGWEKLEPEPGEDRSGQEIVSSIPIYKNKSVGYSTTNIVFVVNGDSTKVYFKKEGESKMAGSSPQNGSLEDWGVSYVREFKYGDGITGVKTPHGLITLTAPVDQCLLGGRFYRGSDGKKYINPIKIVPRVGEDGVGSREETLELYRKLKDLSLGPIHDLYIEAVEHVISKFKEINGLNTGGVFRVKSDDLSKHSDSFDKYLSELNSGDLSSFKGYVSTLTDPLLLADLLKKMYREMPFDIISREELDILTHDNTTHFNESLVGSKRSILLNLLLTLFLDIHNSSYSGEDKMTVEGLKNILVPCLKLDILIEEIISDNGGVMDEGVRESAQEIYDKMETLILYS